MNILRNRLLPTWLAVGIVDFLFASGYAVYNGSTVARLWKGVASTVVGPSATTGGAGAIAVGVLLHFGVALAWSIVFLLLLSRWEGLRRAVRTTPGVLAIAAVVGPVIWATMSLLVIPALTGRPGTVNARWWIQLVAHIPFVALPLVWTAARGTGERGNMDALPATAPAT